MPARSWRGWRASGCRLPSPAAGPAAAPSSAPSPSPWPGTTRIHSPRSTGCRASCGQTGPGGTAPGSPRRARAATARSAGAGSAGSASASGTGSSACPRGRPGRFQCPSSTSPYYDHLLRRDQAGRWWFEALATAAREAALAARLSHLRALLTPRGVLARAPAAPLTCRRAALSPPPRLTTRRRHADAVGSPPVRSSRPTSVCGCRRAPRRRRRRCSRTRWAAPGRPTAPPSPHPEAGSPASRPSCSCAAAAARS